MKSRRTSSRESALAAGMRLPLGGKFHITKEMDDDGVIGHGHDVCVDEDKNLYSVNGMPIKPHR